MNGFGSSSAFALPDAGRSTPLAGLAARRGSRAVRIVPREHLHVTLAFLGRRPAARAARRSLERSARPPPGAERELRAHARSLPRDAQRRHARPRRRGRPRRGARRRTPGAPRAARRLPARAPAVAPAPHRSRGSGSRRGSSRARRTWEHMFSFRPTPLLICLVCARRGASTRSSNVAYAPRRSDNRWTRTKHSTSRSARSSVSSARARS